MSKIERVVFLTAFSRERVDYGSGSAHGRRLGTRCLPGYQEIQSMIPLEKIGQGKPRPVQVHEGVRNQECVRTDLA